MADKVKRRIVIPREVLLVEIDRRCRECNAKNWMGLTKEEARLYHGYKCERCERWNEDTLNEKDIPEWWEELTVTGLTPLRPDYPAGINDEPSATISRMSDEWRRTHGDSSILNPPGESGGEEGEGPL